MAILGNPLNSSTYVPWLVWRQSNNNNPKQNKYLFSIHLARTSGTNVYLHHFLSNTRRTYIDWAELRISLSVQCTNQVAQCFAIVVVVKRSKIRNHKIGCLWNLVEVREPKSWMNHVHKILSPTCLATWNSETASVLPHNSFYNLMVNIHMLSRSGVRLSMEHRRHL